MQTGLLILLLAVAAAQEIFRVRSMNLLGFLWKEHYMVQTVCGVANLLWTWMTVLVGAPIYLSFPVYFLLWYLPFLQARQNKDMIKIFCMMSFLQFSGVYLMFLGVVTVGQISIIRMISTFSVTVSAHLISRIFLCLFYIAWTKFFAEKGDQESRHDHKKSNIFLIFLWICLCYICIDSFLGFVFSDNIFVPILLISGNALILFLAFLFLRHNYFIARNQYLEIEYQKLEEEKARKLLKEERILRMAKTDSMTGAYARGYGMQLLQTYTAEQKFFSVVYMDLDGLKKINDSKGHSAGDQYLKIFAEKMKQYLGKDDLLIRIGGDEFLAVLTDTSSEEANEKIKRIRDEMEYHHGDHMPVYFSFGAACGGKTVEELVKDADHAMYLDKQRRREEE